MHCVKTFASIILLVTIVIPAVAQDSATKRADYYRGPGDQNTGIIRVARFTPVQPKQDQNTRQLTSPSVQNHALDQLVSNHNLPAPAMPQPLATQQNQNQFDELDRSSDSQLARSVAESQPNTSGQSGLDPYFPNPDVYQTEPAMMQPQSTRWTSRTNSLFQIPHHDEWVGFCHCCPLDEIRRYGCNGTNGGCGNGECQSGCGNGCGVGKGRCGKRQSNCGCNVGQKLGQKRCQCKERRDARRDCRQSCRQQETADPCGCSSCNSVNNQ